MNAFASALQNLTFTENGSPTLNSSLNSNVDLFFTIGAMRGQDISRLLNKVKVAMSEDEDLATRILLWSRDVRGGAGERQIFRDVFKSLETENFELFKKVAVKVPELGRWDDLLVAETEEGKNFVFGLIRDALKAENGLAAKWMPRQGKVAVELRNFLKMSPKQYRKTLVGLTKVVESQMCAKEWDQINYEHVPSVASSRYAKAFGKHDTERYVSYLESVTKGEAKINASAIYPYDVLRGWNAQTVQAQWDSLPDFTSDANILPMVDVSGSMTASAGAKGNLTCMDVAVSLGLYLADKNKGAFKNIALTFSEQPVFVTFDENQGILEKKEKLIRSQWAMSTDLDAAFQGILDHAKANRVPQEDMPKFVLVLSDMEFNDAEENRSRYSYNYGSKRVSQRVADAFKAAGYEMPNVVWWNIQSRGDNVPVKFDEKGMALVSGFSPAIVKNVLAAKQIDPVSIMRDAVMVERYNH